jgi:hypothetical protein
MLTSHELFGFMSPALSAQIVDFTFENDKELYRATLASVADAKKLRPIFYERKPRAERNKDIIAMLAKPRLDLIAANLIRGWLLKKHKDMLVSFLDTLGIQHKDGVVDDLPATVDDAKLKEAVDKLLSKYPAEEVSVYLNAFYAMNDVSWPNLKNLLENETRLQFGE